MTTTIKGGGVSETNYSRKQLLRPQTSKASFGGGTGGLGTEQRVTNEEVISTRTQSRERFNNNPASSSQVQRVNSDPKRRSPSPPLFNYKVKFLAKHFNPFDQPEDDKNIYNTNASSESLPRKFKKIDDKEENSQQLHQHPSNTLNPTTLSFIDSNKRTQPFQRPLTAASRLPKNSTIEKNIFDDVKVYETYSKAEIGPQFSQEGEIKPYSIIGKTEWFMRSHQLFLKKGNTDLLHHHISAPITSDRSIAIEKSGQVRSIMQSESSRAGGQISGGSVMSGGHSSNGGQQKSKQKVNFLPENKILVQELDDEEVETCVQMVVKRVDDNRMLKNAQNSQTLKGLKRGDALYLTKEERIIEKFEDNQSRQLRQIKSACKLAKKPIEKSCQLRDMAMKRQKEMKGLLEIAQTDVEKYGGDHHWGKSLRKEKEDRMQMIDQINKGIGFEAIEIKKRCAFDDNTQKQISQKFVEIVRQPVSHKFYQGGAVNKTVGKDFAPFNSFGSDAYFMAKFNEKKEFISKFTNLDDPNAIESIEIIGRSVLKSEVNSLQNSNAKSFIMKVRPSLPNTTSSVIDTEEDSDQQNPQKKLRQDFQRNVSPLSARNISSLKIASNTHLKSTMKIAAPVQDSALRTFLNQNKLSKAAYGSTLNQDEEEVIEEKYDQKAVRTGVAITQTTKLFF